MVCDCPVTECGEKNEVENAMAAVKMKVAEMARSRNATTSPLVSMMALHLCYKHATQCSA